MLIIRYKICERWLMRILFLILILTTSSVLTITRYFDMDRLSTCNQKVKLVGFDVELNGRSNAAPTNPPTECIIYLQSGYTDGENRLELEIKTVQIKDCAIFVDIFNGHGAYGSYLRRLGCGSSNTDNLYSDKQWITIKFKRSTTLYQTDYMFTLKIKTYKDPDVPGIVLGGIRLPAAAIIGIIVGLVFVIVLAVILIWCWRSGKIYDYIGWYPSDKDNKKLNTKEKKPEVGEDNTAIEKSEVGSVKPGIDHKDPAVLSILTSVNKVQRSDGPQFSGRNSYGNARTRTFDNQDQNDVKISRTQNGETTEDWRRQQKDIKQLLNKEIRRGLGSSDHNRKETLIDDVFESDDNKINTRNISHGGDDAYVETPHYLKKCDSASEPFKRDDTTRSSNRNGEGSNRTSLQRKGDGSPIRESLRRGEGGRDSNRSTGSQRENQKAAKTLAEEAAGTKLRSNLINSTQVDPPSDFDSSSFMSVPEPALVTASIHGIQDKTGLSHEENTSEDSELREINSRANQGDADSIPNPNIANNHNKHLQESPKTKKKKKRSPKKNKVDEDVLPPEAFEPLFDRPVSEEPYPLGMQPLNSGYNQYGLPGGMYPMPGYGMPYGMMPAPGTVPPGTQTYAYAYQTMPEPGMPPQQGAGKAAYFVQETPTKSGAIQKTAFMMATMESQPQSHGRVNRGQNDTAFPGLPSYSSTPYGDSPHHEGSGQRKSKHKHPTAVIPAGILPSDNGQGQRTAMMKSGVDPNTGIETNQILWTDTTRDPSDPPPGANPEIIRKTITRTTTRSGYADLPENTDQITDYLYLQSRPNDSHFLSPSNSGHQPVTFNETPDRDNVSYYLGLQHRHDHQGSPQPVIHPAPSRNKAIRDNISIS